MNKIFLFCNTFSLFAGRSNCNVSLPLFGKSNRNFRCLFWCSLTLGWSIGQIGLGLMVSASNLNKTVEKIKRNIKYNQQKHNNKSSMPVNLEKPEKNHVRWEKVFLENEKKNISGARIYCRSLFVLSMPIAGNLSYEQKCRDSQQCEPKSNVKLKEDEDFKTASL